MYNNFFEFDRRIEDVLVVTRTTCRSNIKQLHYDLLTWNFVLKSVY